MYNLIMGAVEGSLGADRMLEGVDADLDDFLRPGGPASQRARLTHKCGVRSRRNSPA
jgi:hypothetical protein